MSKYTVNVGPATLTVALGNPEDDILVDGEAFGYQCADGGCNTERCLRIAVAAAYQAEVYDDAESAEADGRSVDDDHVIAWDDVYWEEEEEEEAES